MPTFQLIREGAPARKALDKLRSDIRGARKTIEDVQSAEVPAEEVRSRLRNAIDAAIYNRTPENNFVRFALPDHREDSLPAVIGFPDLAWILGPENLVELVMKRLAARGRDAGLPAAQRAAKLGELRTQLEKLERLEEKEILTLEVAGHTILRREDARPDLLFEIWAETT